VLGSVLSNPIWFGNAFLIASATLVWFLLLGPPLARAAALGGSLVGVATLYVVGVGQVLITAAGLDFEHGMTLTSTPQHDLVSQLVFVASFALIGLSIVGAIQGLDVAWRWWVFGIVGYGLSVALSAWFNGTFDVRQLVWPGLAFAVTRARRMTVGQVVTHLRYILRFTTFGSLALLEVAPTQAIMLLQGRTIFGVGQLAGVTAHPNALGPIAATALAVELTTVSARRRSLVGITAAGLCCLLAQSRAGWLTAGVVLLVLAAHRLGTRVVSVVTAALASFAWYILSNPGISGINTTLNGRGDVWSVALAVFRDHVQFGGGPNALRAQVELHKVSAFGAQAHNQILETLAIAGLFGLAFLLIFVVDAIHRARAQFTAGAAVPLAVLCLVLVDGAFESSLQSPSIIALSTLCLLTATVRPRIGAVAAESSSVTGQPGLRSGHAPILRRRHGVFGGVD
jgi:O-Antigen ligase